MARFSVGGMPLQGSYLNGQAPRLNTLYPGCVADTAWLWTLSAAMVGLGAV